MIPLFSALLIISLVLMFCAFLLPRKKTKPTPAPAPQPSVTRIGKEVIYDDTPGRNYPLKVYVEFRNSSSDYIDVKVSRWASGIDAQIFHQVLQIWTGYSWHPTPDGLASLPIRPGSTFRLWIAPNQGYSKPALQALCDHDRLGTLMLLINNQDRSFVV